MPIMMENTENPQEENGFYSIIREAHDISEITDKTIRNVEGLIDQIERYAEVFGWSDESKVNIAICKLKGNIFKNCNLL